MRTAFGDRVFFGSIQLLAVANSIFVLLSLTRWFGGSAAAPGVVDHLFGTLGNFRVDFIWLVVSSLGLFVAGLICVFSSQRERSNWRTAILCFAENAIFFTYIVHAFLAGLVDFG